MAIEGEQEQYPYYTNDQEILVFFIVKLNKFVIFHGNYSFEFLIEFLSENFYEFLFETFVIQFKYDKTTKLDRIGIVST